MKGVIKSFDNTKREGLITGEDGVEYNLTMDEWKSGTLPETGMNVDFALSDGKATAVFGEAVSSASSKKIPAALLAFFFGAFGVHKFYLGYTKEGLIMLLAFLFGFILLGIPSIIIGIIAFVEFIIYLIKPDKEFDATYVNGHKGWF
jgi:TM2 domain.